MRPSTAATAAIIMAMELAGPTAFMPTICGGSRPATGFKPVGRCGLGTKTGRDGGKDARKRLAHRKAVKKQKAAARRAGKR